MTAAATATAASSSASSTRRKRDEISWEQYIDVGADVHFVQVGANCGSTECAYWGEPIWPYSTKHNWAGVALEPNPYAFKKLQANYKPYPRVRPLELAAGGQSGNLTFYMPSHVDESLGAAPDTEWTTLSLDHFWKHCPNCPPPEERLVRVVTLPELWRQVNFPKVDVLVIDAEGYDYEILSCDLKELGSCPGGLPKMILVEKFHLTPDEDSKLLSHLSAGGYQLAETTAHDYLFKHGV